MAMSQLTKVAVVQAAPVILNCVATTEKVCRLIREAAKGRARLVLLPEAFISSLEHNVSIAFRSISKHLAAARKLLVFMEQRLGSSETFALRRQI
jgi:predicted amidohydrolase